MVFTTDHSVRLLDPGSQADYQVMHTTKILLMARHKPNVSWELHMHLSASMCLFLLKESEVQNSASVMCDFQTRLTFTHALQRQVSSLQLSAALQEAKTQHAKLRLPKWAGIKFKEWDLLVKKIYSKLFLSLYTFVPAVNEMSRMTVG